MTPNIPLLLVALIAATALAGCVSEDQGYIAVYVKDAVTDDFEHLHLTLGNIRLHRAGAEADANDTDGPGWRTIAREPQEVDLLRFTKADARALVANTSIEVGRYNQVLIEVTDARGVLKEDRREVMIDVIQPELRLTRAFNVTNTATTMIIIDIDLERSLMQQGNGPYRLKPVIGSVLIDEDSERLQRSMSDDGVPDHRPEPTNETDNGAA